MFPRQAIQNHNNPSLRLSISAKVAEVDLFYEGLEDLLKPKKYVLFIIRDWNAKVGSQDIPGVTGKFGLGGKMKQGKY